MSSVHAVAGLLGEWSSPHSGVIDNKGDGLEIHHVTCVDRTVVSSDVNSE